MRKTGNKVHTESNNFTQNFKKIIVEVLQTKPFIKITLRPLPNMNWYVANIF